MTEAEVKAYLAKLMEPELKALHARCDAFNHRYTELEQDLDSTNRKSERLSRHIRILLAALTEITDAHKAVAGSVPVVIEAEQAIQAVLLGDA